MSELVLEKDKNLPMGWAKTTLNYLVTSDSDSLLRGPFGSSLKKEHFISSGYKVYEQKNSIQNDFNLGHYYVNEKKFKELKRFELKSGDVIMTCAGTIGRLAVAPENIERGIINSALLKIRLEKKIINQQYFMYLMKSPLVQSSIQSEARGSAMNNLKSVKSLKAILLPIPPLNEQKRIIVKIEELFSTIEEVERILKITKLLLDRFKLSLRANYVPKAFVDFLTEASFDLSNFEVLQKQYERKLPSGWEIKEIGDVCDLVTDGSHQTPPRLKSGKLMLSARNVRDGYISTNEVSYVSEDHFNREIKRVLPQKNDVLLVSVGATIGRAAIVRNESPFMIVRSVALLRPNERTNPMYLLKWIQNPYVQKIIKRMVHDTARGGLYLNKIKRIPILIPSTAVQNDLTFELESKESYLAFYDSSFSMIMDLIPRLKNTILKLAFDGNLVLQDPKDSSAEILLQEIRREKERLRENRKVIKAKPIRARRTKNAK